MQLDKKKIGKQIKMCRIMRHLTQEDLSEKIDISSSYMSLIETGKKSMSLETAIAIADILKVPMDVLFQDNRVANAFTDSEVAFLLEDCNILEKNIIFDTIFALRKTLRDNKKK